MQRTPDASSQPGDATLTPLNAPRPLEVTTDADGAPHDVTWDGRRVAVESVLDSWRIDDEWWREEISRRYYHLLLADGRTLTVFADLIAGGWYAQRYGSSVLPAAVRVPGDGRYALAS